MTCKHCKKLTEEMVQLKNKKIIDRHIIKESYVWICPKCNKENEAKRLIG